MLVIADVEQNFYTLNPKEIEKKISKKTKAIIPVHIYGQCCNMSEIIKIAKKNKIFVIEDCSQSLGSKIGNKKAGTFGDIGTFSFYPTKNLGLFLCDREILLKRAKHIKINFKNLLYSNIVIY